MNQWDGIVHANPSEGLAFVMSKLGRYHLYVGGVVVATEGDVCRDPMFADRVWTRLILEDAANRINEQATKH